jgi:GNAT superfamily N-acetyltransferase
MDRTVGIQMVAPDVAGLHAAAAALREWQVDRAPMQLHPGDLGWHWRDGPEATAADLRIWSREERIVAIGMLDAPQLLRMAVAPDLQDDAALIGRIVDDIVRSERGVLATGSAVVEARCGRLLTESLSDLGWQPGESWTPLHLDLTEPPPDAGLRIEAIGPDGADEWLGVHWSAFRKTPMTAEDLPALRRRWDELAASAPYAEAKCLTGYDANGDAVAIAGVWSAGRGRPGLLEPIGVSPAHRGRGYGRAITLGAATALREMGSSSAVVCTPTARPGAVETYASAGMQRSPAALDLERNA